jgi:GNAT superfamily N-acetyltransferase
MMLERLQGPKIGAVIEALGRFRITIFREYPYLYDGSMEYEREYLSRYAASTSSVVLFSRDAHGLVAAATGIALAEETSCFIQPFCADPSEYFYIGEVMVRADCRRQGWGSRLLAAMLDAARAQGFAKACLYTVRRDPGHPAKPSGYWSADALWERFGFAKVPGCETPCPWKEIGEAEETEKPMEVWTLDL